MMSSAFHKFLRTQNYYKVTNIAVLFDLYTYLLYDASGVVSDFDISSL